MHLHFTAIQKKQYLHFKFWVLKKWILKSNSWEELRLHKSGKLKQKNLKLAIALMEFLMKGAGGDFEFGENVFLLYDN